MVYRRSFLNKRPILSIKHIVDVQGGTVAATQSKTSIAVAVENPVLANSTDVKPGSRVNSIYLDVQAIGLAAPGILNNIYMIIYKIPGSNIAGSAIPNANATGIDNFKRQIFHTEMRMLNDTLTSQPIQIFKGVIRIPKIFHTFRFDDYIQIQLFTPGATANFCIQAIYKEYQ